MQGQPMMQTARLIIQAATINDIDTTIELESHPENRIMWNMAMMHSMKKRFNTKIFLC